MQSFPRIPTGARGRTLLYAVAFPGAVALDFLTPLGIADWLIELILVWIASSWGDRRETRVVSSAAAATILVGLWSSPATLGPFWVGALNRSVAIVVIWSIVHVADRRREADQAHTRAASQIRILHGLLPICAACKAIRNTQGEWRSLESYLVANSEARLTHSLCPNCLPKYMEGLSEIPTT